MPKISVIVPIKNQYKIVQKCLESLEKHYKNEEVVMIDDGSTEEDLKKYLAQKSSQNNWKLIQNLFSQGHTLSCKQGIECSSCENIILLNSDTIVTKNGLYLLQDALDQNSKIGVCGPSTSSTSGEQLIRELYNKRFLMRDDEIEKLALELEINKEIIDIDLVGGFCMGMKRSVFNEIGGFDEVLHDYGNEKELQIRVRKAGWRTVWVRGSYCHHFGKVSYGSGGFDIMRAQIDSDRHIRAKHGVLR